MLIDQSECLRGGKKMKKIESIEQFRELTKGARTVFMFSANWCGDCKFIEPYLPEIERENSDFDFYLVDRDQFIDLCSELAIFGIPSFLVYEDGIETGRFVNGDRKTKTEINDFLQAI